MRLIVILLCLATRLAATPLTTDRALLEMTRWEGHKLRPYRDADGWSVGVGHALTRHGEPVKRLYSRAEVYQLFLHDLAVSLEICRSGVRGFDDLPTEVQLVCVNLAWTCGPAGFMAFRDLRFSLSHRAYDAATTALYLSQWYRTQPAARANWAIHVLRSQ